MSLTNAILSGDRLALARILTQVENDSPEGREALIELYPHAGRSHVIGVTGAPGTGKSSLVNQLTLYYRKTEKKRVAIVAVDPSSPFTGGAVLGDRVRMRDLSGDADVFIRSMATRGSLGGLARATADLAQVFDAAGFDRVIVETVGAGQSEVEVARLAHTTIVVEAPGLGDEIQAIKAGILEIADILVVNKADRPGVENTEKALKSMIELAHPTRTATMHHGQRMETAAPNGNSPRDVWIPPILRTIATDGTGVEGLTQAIAKHVAYLRQSGEWAGRERARLEVQLDILIREALVDRFREKILQQKYSQVLDQLVQRKLSPWEAANSLMNGTNS